jgi:hypothetical protein
MKGLVSTNAGQIYNADAAKYLYTVLMQPLQKDIEGMSSLIIIPGQELINVPFEGLQTANDKYLVEDYAISYQYAIPFLKKEKVILMKRTLCSLHHLLLVMAIQNWLYCLLLLMRLQHFQNNHNC